MKNYFKFVVVVFSITVTTLGSMESKAKELYVDDAAAGYKCVAPYNRLCATLESGKKLSGVKVKA